MDINFYKVVLSATLDRKQQRDILKTITSRQYRTLRSFAQDILTSRVDISGEELKALSKYKNFIRRLHRGEVGKESIGYKNNNDILQLMKIYVSKNESSGKDGTSSYRTMGKSERKTKQNTRAIEREIPKLPVSSAIIQRSCESDTATDNSINSSEGDTESISSYRTGSSEVEMEEEEQVQKDTEEESGEERKE